MNTFLDDHAYPFKVNPQFKAWVPVTQVPNCWLLVDGVNKPKLWFYLPVDYWHNVEPLPTSFWTEEIEVIALPKADGIGSQLPAARGNIGYIGPVPERALGLDIPADKLNPKGVLDYLHYYRAYKTDYELYCMREAQKTAVNGEQLALIGTMKAGTSYVDYHIQFHQRIAKLLRKHQIVKDMSEEAMVENDLTGPFMPHGIGHPLGLQVHDVAGFMQDDTGTHLAAPSKYPYLRCTRILEPRMVLTIEPGIYFIESLLAPWREGQFSKHFNWEKIDALKPFGGIRIEDNVVVHENGIENMTRDLKLA